MSYAVHHLDAEGRAQLEDVGSLEEALSRVEDLSNDAVSEVRVLKEVPIEVRTYYRVVAVQEGADTIEAPAEPQPVAAAAEVEPEQPPQVETVVAAVEEPERPRIASVVGEPPSGAVVMGPPPASAAHEAVEAPTEPAQEPRRALFGRS